MKTVYCVQCFAGSRGALVKGRLWQFGHEEEARAAGELLEGRVAAWVLFKVQGEPDFDLWEEPEVLATYGGLPEDLVRAAA